MTKKIALIDDSSTFCLLVKQILNLKSYEVDSYSKAEDFFSQKSKLKAYDLIILDLNLPGMNGMTALENLKGEYHTSKIPVVLLTGETTLNVVIQARQLKVNSLISKPIDPPFFLERIEELLGTNKA